MKHEFLDYPQEKPRRGGAAVPIRRGDAGLFWWTVLITLLLALATFCWFFTISVFTHPEKPFNYRVLSKLNKLPALKDFSNLNVPTGKFYSPKGLYQQFYGYNQSHLRVRNAILKRHFLSNYKKERPIYLRGTFQIDAVRKLSAEDVFSSGLVVRGESIDYPNVSIEYVLPADEVAEDAYKVGDVLELTGSGNFASVLHVERLAAEQIHLTAVSITYPVLENGEGQALALRPPERLNMDGNWPLAGGRPAVTTVADAAGVNLTEEVETATP